MTSRTKLAAAAGAATAVAASPAMLAAATYVVRPGDNLSAIAARHHTTVSAIAQANHIANPNLIKIGQLLTIPDTKAGLPGYTQTATDAELYIVNPGDGLIHVAREFGVDVAGLARANGLTVNTSLQVGQQLRVPGRLSRVSALINRTAAEVGVDPKLMRAVAWMESGWQQGAVSPTGAVGIMQIEPYTGDWISQYLSHRPLDIANAQDNVLAGALLLRHLLNVHNGDIDAALAAYYQGDASITRHGLYDDTKQYQRVITTLMHRE